MMYIFWKRISCPVKEITINNNLLKRTKTKKQYRTINSS